MRSIVILTLILMFSVSGSAQTSTAAPASQPAPAATPAAQAEAAAAPAIPVPSEMKRLADLMVGTWKTKETHYPGPFMPEGGTGEGTNRIRLGPGGLSLVQQYRSKNANGKFEGHGVVYWDSKASVYKSFWCDNMTPNGCDGGGSGKWEGDKLVFIGMSEMDGKKFTMRETYSNFTPQGYKFLLETGDNASSMKPFIEITYTKAPEPKVVLKKAPPKAKPASPATSPAPAAQPAPASQPAPATTPK